MKLNKLRLKYNKPFVVGGRNDHEQQISNHWNIAKSWIEKMYDLLEDEKNVISKRFWRDIIHALANAEVALYNQAQELARKEEYGFDIKSDTIVTAEDNGEDEDEDDDEDDEYDNM